MEESREAKENDKYLIPAAIVAAGVLVAAAVIYSRGSLPAASQTAKVPSVEKPVGVKPVTGEDHILGNPDADVKLIEFSDLECPFCKRVHPTLKQVVEQYGKEGKVAWVYRHFPLDSIHPKADKEAEASECAAELGGNDAFWRYVDKVYEVTPSNNGLDPALLPKIAGDLGLDAAKFNECLESGKYAAKVEGHTQEAVAAGGNGTPYTIVVAKNGKTFPIFGAVPFSDFQAAIEEALK